MQYGGDAFGPRAAMMVGMGDNWFTRLLNVSLVDLGMTVANIFGIAATIILLQAFTPLPYWLAVVLAIPLFIAVFWGALWLLHRKWRD